MVEVQELFRMGPIAGNLKVLSSDELRLIHQASLNVLERTGIVFKSREALRELDRAGVPINYEKQEAKIPSQLVDESLHSVPSKFMLYARKPEHDLQIGDGGVSFTNGFSATYVLDSLTMQRRLATLSDLRDFTRIADALRRVDYVITQCVPQDIPKEVVELYIPFTMFKNTSKHCYPATYTLQGARDMITMASILVGGREEFIKKPGIVNGVVCPTSPLRFSVDAAERLMEFSRHRIPFGIWSAPMAGATAPATLAGTLVVQNAEVLAGLVLSQLVGPGTPIMYGSGASVMDMMYGTSASGSPELGLLNVASAQLAHHYRLPCYGTGGVIDSKTPDGQAAYECMMSNLLCALAGVDVIHDGVYGILESGMTANYGQFLISHEIVEMTSRVLKGIHLDEDSLAEELIVKVGPGGDYLTQRHTQQSFRREHWIPTLTDRAPRSEWERLGSKNVLSRAEERAREILRTHMPEPLDSEVQKRLEDFVTKREKELVEAAY
jgi:trimethylamine--corrinoid protein Co-methyltransferase